ncbi:hypothetical protein Tco_1125874, partial [Tanacetum coccineum]
RDMARDMQYATDLTKLWQELAERVVRPIEAYGIGEADCRNAYPGDRKNSFVTLMWSLLNTLKHFILASASNPPNIIPQNKVAASDKGKFVDDDSHNGKSMMPADDDMSYNGCGYFMWKDDLRLRLSSSPGPLTPPSSSPGHLTRPGYSPGPSRSAPSLGKTEFSNKGLDQVVNTLASGDRGQGFDPYPFKAGGPFLPLVEPEAAFLPLVGVKLSASQPPSYIVEDGIETYNPWKTVLGVTFFISSD